MDEYKVLDEAGQASYDAQNHEEVYERFLGSVHIMPEGSAEVPDEQSVRVVVLGPEHTHRSNNSDSEAMTEFITEIMKQSR